MSLCSSKVVAFGTSEKRYRKLSGPTLPTYGPIKQLVSKQRSPIWPQRVPRSVNKYISTYIVSHHTHFTCVHTYDVACMIRLFLVRFGCIRLHPVVDACVCVCVSACTRASFRNLCYCIFFSAQSGKCFTRRDKQANRHVHIHACSAAPPLIRRYANKQML